MTTLNIHEIKAKFSHYAKLVMKGKSFVIAIRNKPFAILSPLPESFNRQKRLVFGAMKQRFEVPDDFNKPLKEFEKDFYSFE